MRVLVVLALASAAAVAEDDLETLVGDLGSKTYSTRDRASQLLTARKDARVIPMIEKRIESWAPENQYRALTVIGSFPPRQSHPVFRRLTKSADPHLRVAAAAQLLRQGVHGMDDVILEVLRGPPPADKIQSIVGRLGYLRVPAIYDAWRDLITPEQAEMSLYLWFASLSSEGYEGAQPQAKRILEKDTRPGPRAVACAYLIRCRDAAHAPTLAKLLREERLDSSSISRVRYVLRDGGIYPREVCDAILERLPDESSSFVAVQLIEILAAARHFAARKKLGELVEHESADVAEAALGALAALDGVPEAGIVRRMLTSDDPARRLMAARILRRMDDESGFPAVLQVAKEAKKDDLRRDAMQILGEFRRADAVETLLDGMADADALVRSYAASALLVTLRTIYPYRRFDLASVGFTYKGPAAERAAALVKLRAWWEKNRDAEW